MNMVPAHISAVARGAMISHLQIDINNGTRWSRMSIHQQAFLTQSVIRSAADETNMYHALMEDPLLAILKDRERENLARKIAKSCPKLFVVCLAPKFPFSFLTEAADKRDAFNRTIRFTDEKHLPLDHTTSVDDYYLNSFVGGFLQSQMALLCPSFRKGDFGQKFPDLLPLAIRKCDELGPGSSGSVQPVLLHQDYFKFKEAPGIATDHQC
jgi:hypothetical protein